MNGKSINRVPRGVTKEIMGILMENTLYLELPLPERFKLFKYIFNLFSSRRSYMHS
jgi:hypothetical protein